MTYRITVLPLGSDRTITFHDVQLYDIIDGFVKFIDTKTGSIKRFPAMNCEITEEVEQ